MQVDAPASDVDQQTGMNVGQQSSVLSDGRGRHGLGNTRRSVQQDDHRRKIEESAARCIESVHRRDSLRQKCIAAVDVTLTHAPQIP